MKSKTYQVAWNNRLDPTRYSDVTAINAEQAIRKLRKEIRDEYPDSGQVEIEEVYKI